MAEGATGVDMPTTHNIVLVRVINSMTEFKQIIGRGTRVRDEYLPRSIPATRWREFMTKTELYGEQWLLSYEARLKGWRMPTIGEILFKIRHEHPVHIQL